MANIEIKNASGKKVKSTELSAAVFGIEPNMHAMHEVVRAQRAAWRSGTHEPLTRSQVRGGGKKPWRQKGTGRARAGTSRSPLWRGGGIIHGPQPRCYEMRVPKKVRRLALKMALTQKLHDRELTVLDQLRLDRIRTKDFAALLNRFELRKTLVVIPDRDEVIEKSARNIPNVKVLRSDGLNVYDLLNYHSVIMTQDTVGKIQESLGS